MSNREDITGFPSQYWSTQLDLLPERNLNGNWRGTTVTMTPDLRVSTPAPIQLHWGWEGHNTYFYPDGISLSCPNQLSVGNEFVIAANWLVTSDQLQQLIIKYNESGAFSSVRLELLQRSGEAGNTSLQLSGVCTYRAIQLY